MKNKFYENCGRIVPGENTTKDVHYDSIKKEAEKFGNQVDINGFPKFNIADYMKYFKEDISLIFKDTLF